MIGGKISLLYLVAVVAFAELAVFLFIMKKGLHTLDFECHLDAGLQTVNQVVNR